MARDALDDHYAKAGFQQTLPFGKHPALLLVDVVRAYVDPASPLFAPPFVTALQSCARVVEATRAAGLPVIFTSVAFQQDGRDGGLFFRKVGALRCFLPGSPLAAFAPGLAPQPHDIVVTKQYASAFFGTSLASTLNALRVDTVLVAGFSTSGCVRASAVDALQHGFAPFVIADACGDRDARPHDANLFDLRSKYAEVVTEAEAVRLLRDTP